MIVGKLRIIAKTKEEAEEIAGYINRRTSGKASFYRAKLGQKDEWIAYGDIDVPDQEDTRTWKEKQ
ncbi:MAG TPA: hypothetical protein VF909_20235 [Roseiflexaceae bacterium]